MASFPNNFPASFPATSAMAEGRATAMVTFKKAADQQVPTAGQISFTIQETGKVAILCRSGSNTVEVIDAVTIQSQKK